MGELVVADRVEWAVRAVPTGADLLTGETVVVNGEWRPTFTVPASIAAGAGWVLRHRGVRDGAATEAWRQVLLTLLGTPSVTALSGWAGANQHEGIRRDLTGTWMNRESWANLRDANYINAPENGLPQWLALDPGNIDRAVDVGTPLIPHNGGSGGEHTTSGRSGWNALLDEAISGAQDATYTSLGRRLAEYGPATVFARLWWEMNQYPASIDAAKFRAAWARAVPLIRAGFAAAARPGQHLFIVFCPMASLPGRWTMLPADLAHVDVLALDLYAALWGRSIPTAAALLAYTGGMLTELADKGRELGKPVALGEWGNWQTNAANTTTDDNHGRADFPEFIDQVADWADAPANNVRYLSYFDIAGGGVGITLNDTPLSRARLAARFAPAP